MLFIVFAYTMPRRFWQHGSTWAFVGAHHRSAHAVSFNLQNVLLA